MDKINIGGGSSGDNETRTTIADRPIRKQQLAINSQLKSINDSINTFCVEIEEGEAMNHCHFQTINKNIQRMTMFSFTRSSARMIQEQKKERGTRQSASLSNTLRTLYAQWKDYTKGLGGTKATKDFTAKERGTVKHKFSRKFFFGTV